MMTPELQDYINQSKAAGMTDEQIRQALLNQGWTTEQIDEAISVPAGQAPATPVGMSRTTKLVLVVIVISVFLSALIATAIYGYGAYKLNKMGVSLTDLSKNVSDMNGYCTNNDSVKLYSFDPKNAPNDNETSVTTSGKVKTFKNSPFDMSFDFPCGWTVESIGVYKPEMFAKSITAHISPVDMSCNAFITVSGDTAKITPRAAGPEDTSTEVTINGNKFFKLTDRLENSDAYSTNTYYDLEHKGAHYQFNFNGIESKGINECDDQIMKNLKIN